MEVVLKTTSDPKKSQALSEAKDDRRLSFTQVLTRGLLCGVAPRLLLHTFILPAACFKFLL